MCNCFNLKGQRRTDKILRSSNVKMNNREGGVIKNVYDVSIYNVWDPLLPQMSDEIE